METGDIDPSSIDGIGIVFCPILSVELEMALLAADDVPEEFGIFAAEEYNDEEFPEGGNVDGLKLMQPAISMIKINVMEPKLSTNTLIFIVVYLSLPLGTIQMKRIKIR